MSESELSGWTVTLVVIALLLTLAAAILSLVAASQVKNMAQYSSVCSLQKAYGTLISGGLIAILGILLVAINGVILLRRKVYMEFVWLLTVMGFGLACGILAAIASTDLPASPAKTNAVIAAVITIGGIGLILIIQAIVAIYRRNKAEDAPAQIVAPPPPANVPRWSAAPPEEDVPLEVGRLRARPPTAEPSAAEIQAWRRMRVGREAFPQD